MKKKKQKEVQKSSNVRKNVAVQSKKNGYVAIFYTNQAFGPNETMPTKYKKESTPVESSRNCSTISGPPIHKDRLDGITFGCRLNARCTSRNSLKISPESPVQLSLPSSPPAHSCLSPKLTEISLYMSEHCWKL